ncbi:MAG TPA: ABC transporter permease [Candidatus Polarisedimenticolaceae bacterium]|nr:ABC transporter permease [Candidatus Polarisedimenticolaceae bacterium]
MLRALIHYWRVTGAVVAGAAVATAVLSGALMVGDSVRGSLRRLTLDRLGAVERALVGERFFREELASELSAALDGTLVVPLIIAQGSAIQPDSGARASRVEIHGVDERFAALFPTAPTLDFARSPTQPFPSAIVNRSLADELRVAEGEDLLLGFGTSSDVPRETLMGESDPDDVLASLRVTVTRIVPDAGVGRFGLAPNQIDPFNVFVALGGVQRAVEQRRRVNALLVGETATGIEPGEVLERTLTFEDLGLELTLADDHATLGSRDFVLRPDVGRAATEVLDALGALGQPVLTYLANRLRHGDEVVPYSSVTAVDPLDGPDWASFEWHSRRGPDSGPRADGIVLNRWTADALHAAEGDTIELEYFEVGPREELILREHRFRVAGVVEPRGLAGDPGLTPEYPGIQQAEDMAGWDPPFPVDLGLIGDRDEEYWDRYRALPKAFVGYDTGARLWSTRFGSITTIRFGAAPGSDVAGTAERLRRELRSRLAPAAFGFRLRPVKEEGLRASAGATDFGGLFIGFSLFLIASAAMLAGLLFGLGVERRAGEIGLLLAVGYRLRRVRGRLLGEGASIAMLGALFGLGLGVAYAALMMVGLRTIWAAAVGSSRLVLFVEPSSLALGWVLSVVVVLTSIWFRVERLKRIAPARLLAGSLAGGPVRHRAGLPRWIALAAASAATTLVVVGLVTGRPDDPALAFGSGALLLVAGLATFAWWCRGAGRRRGVHRVAGGLTGLAARNSAWNPGRSILSAALVACACFVIVVVAANRGQSSRDMRALESGSGGFPLLAESRVPLFGRLDSRADLLELGFDAGVATRLADNLVVPLRSMPGDDASCLNLYRPERPRILGVPPQLVERAGFTFRQALPLADSAASPWDLLEAPSADGTIPAIGDHNSTTWILRLGLGDGIELTDELGRTVTLRLVATLDTSVFQSELLISEADFLEHFPGRSGYGYFLIDTPSRALDETAALYERTLAPFGFDVSTSAEKLESFKVVEHTYLATFQLLGGLGLLLGTVGLAVILLRNVIERRGELATLRAFGFRRASLARMILIENLFLLVVGVSIGTVAALVAVGPRLLRLDVPWLSIATTLGIVVAVGMLASVAAVRGALRVPLLPALKAER